MSRGYQPTMLEDELSAKLSGILGEHLVGKNFTIYTGSSRIPRAEVVKILDVDPDNQRIVLQTSDEKLKFLASYDDFFYHKKQSNLSDGERALKALAPNIVMPKKDGILSSTWKNILKIKPPWAKD